MAVRLWMALLALAAVFAMHGGQCITAADRGADAFSLAATGLTSGLTHHHAHEMAGAGTAPVDPFAAAPVAGSAEPGLAIVVGVSAIAAAGHGGVPHDTAAHLWTVCLAVLAAALAVLLAWLVPRSVRLGVPALGAARTRLRSLAPPRPPELSALCLLRI